MMSDLNIVYWRRDNNNWGDAISPVIASYMSGGVNTHYIDPVDCTTNVTRYAVIGSILQAIKSDRTEVWGSGFISKEPKGVCIPKRIHSVRGPLSRRVYTRLGIKCPEIYGDPALLMPLIYPSAGDEATYDLGIVPHWTELDDPRVQMLSESSRVKVISPLNTAQEMLDKQIHQ